MPNVYAEAKHFRASLLKRDAEAAARLTLAYKSIRERLDAEARALLARVEEAQSSGQPVKRAWLFQERRYQSLVRQAEEQLTLYARGVETILTARQQAEVSAGLAESAELIRAAGGEVSAGFPALPTRAVENVVGFTANGSPLSSLLGREFGRRGAEFIKAKLIEGVGAGKGVRVMAREVRDAVGVPLSRAQTIVRTESLRAYRTATLGTFESNSDILRAWKWTAALSPRTCLACLAMDGKEFPLEKPMPAHPNCVIEGTSVTAPPLRGATKRGYAGEVVEIQTVSGHHLTVTPNHPILTPYGWLPAGLLDEGGYLFSGSHLERVFAAVYPENDNAPSRIEDVFEAFRQSVGMTSRSVPAAAEYFHGDGEGSEIEVVWPDGLLRSGFDAESEQPFGQLPFVNRLPDLLGLDSFGPPDFLFQRHFSLANCVVCGSGVSQVFFGSARGHHYPIGLRDGATIDAALGQDARNYVARNLEGIGNGFFRLPRFIAPTDFTFGQGDFTAPQHNAVLFKRPENDAAMDFVGFGQFYRALSGQIPRDGFFGRNIAAPLSLSDSSLTFSDLLGLLCGTEQASLLQVRTESGSGNVQTMHRLRSGLAAEVRADRILKVSKRDFLGHVYNLETELGWFGANGIITHNCRCTAVGVLRRVPLPPRETGAEWFERQDDATKREMMGARAFELYQSGKLTLDDFVGESRSREWGAATFRRSLRQIEGGRALPRAASRKLRNVLDIDDVVPGAGAQSLDLGPEAKAARAAVLKADREGLARVTAAEARYREHMGRMPKPTDPPQTIHEWNSRALALYNEHSRAAAAYHDGMRRHLYRDTPAQFAVRLGAEFDAAERDQIWAAVGEFKRFVGAGHVDGETVEILLTGEGRSYFRDGKVYLSRQDFGGRSVNHELGHWLEEKSPGVFRAVSDFLARRTAGESPVPMRNFNPKFGGDEYARPDRFLSPYMGAVYERGGKRSGSEIVSMGVEYFQKDPARLAADDPDMFDFIYNLLRGR